MIFLRNGFSSSTLRLFYKTINNLIVEYHKKANINDKYHEQRGRSIARFAIVESVGWKCGR